MQTPQKTSKPSKKHQLRFSRTFASLALFSNLMLSTGTASANLESLYEDDKCKYLFESGYCLSALGTVYKIRNVGCNPVPLKVGILNQEYSGRSLADCQSLTGTVKRLFKYNEQRTGLILFSCVTALLNAECIDSISKENFAYLGQKDLIEKEKAIRNQQLEEIRKRDAKGYY